MAKFLYRMQNILDIKYKLEEQAKQQYMEVRMRLNQAMDELKELNKRKEFYFDTYRELVSKELEVLEIEGCKESILIMDEYIANQKLVISAIEKELEQAELVLREAMQERKIHEKLKDNQFEEFLQELNAEEAKEIDELVSYQYNDKTKKVEE